VAQDYLRGRWRVKGNVESGGPISLAGSRGAGLTEHLRRWLPRVVATSVALLREPSGVASFIAFCSIRRCKLRLYSLYARPPAPSAGGLPPRPGKAPAPGTCRPAEPFEGCRLLENPVGSVSLSAAGPGGWGLLRREGCPAGGERSARPHPTSPSTPFRLTARSARRGGRRLREVHAGDINGQWRPPRRAS